MKSKLLSQIFIFFGLSIALETSAMKQLFNKADKKDFFKKTFSKTNIVLPSSSKKFYNNAGLFSSLSNKFVKTDQETINNKPVVPKKTFPLQQKQSFKTFGFNKNKINAIPSTGYFAQRLYTAQTPKSQKNERKEDQKIITIDPDKPESEKQVLDMINTWQELPLEGKRFYSGWSIIKKTARGVLGLVIAGVAAGAAYIYDRYMNLAHESKIPLPPTQETYRYPEKFYKYALDGEMARKINPLDLLKELHKDGLTSEDLPMIQCQIQEDEMFKKIIDLANLSEHDQKMLQNILSLRHSFFNGHYNKNNVRYKGTFDQSLKKIIESTLQKADIPFKITVIDEHWLVTEDILAANVLGLKSNLKFEYHIETGSAGLKKNSLDLKLYISPNLKLREILEQKATISHEITHMVNLDNLQILFLLNYLSNVKKVDINTIIECCIVFRKNSEYLADVGPLSNPEYAEAQRFRFRNAYQDRSDIYIPVSQMIELSSRAVKLHKAEKELEKSPSSWPRYFGFKIEEAQD